MKGVLIGGAVTTNASQPTEFDGLIGTSSVSDGELSGGYGIIGESMEFMRRASDLK